MRNRRNILNAVDSHVSGSDTSYGGFASGARTFDTDFNIFHAESLSLFCGISGDHLSGISGALARTFETVLTAGGPAKDVAVEVSECNFRVIESGMHESDSRRDVTTGFFAFSGIGFSCGGLFRSGGSRSDLFDFVRHIRNKTLLLMIG